MKYIFTSLRLHKVHSKPWIPFFTGALQHTDRAFLN